MYLFTFPFCRRFTIVATDQGQPQQHATANLVIFVNDVNDNAPVFTQPRYSFGVYENEGGGMNIGHVRAADADDSPHNDVAYFLEPRADDVDADVIRRTFRIDSVTGLIETLVDLDREARDKYEMVARAANVGGRADLDARVNVTIHVADKNDNAPVVVFPRHGNNTVNVTTAPVRGATLTHVEAFDVDLGEGGDLRFSLLQGNEQGYFAVNSVLGEVFLAKSLDTSLLRADEQFVTFNLKVMVSDNGEPRLYATADLRLVFPVAGIVMETREQQSRDTSANLVAVLVACSLCACVVFVICFIIVMLVARRRKQPQASNRDRERSGCIEATKSLLAISSCPEVSEPPAKQALAQGRTEQGSLDSGVDIKDGDRNEVDARRHEEQVRKHKHITVTSY